MGAKPSRRKAETSLREPSATKAALGTGAAPSSPSSCPSTAPPPLHSARSRTEAWAALERRRQRQPGSEAGLQKILGALQVLSTGRPAGLVEPPAALEEFFRSEGVDGSSEASRRMHVVLGAVADASAAALGSGHTPLPGSVGSSAAGDLSEFRDLAAADAAMWDRFRKWCWRMLLIEAFRLCDNTHTDGGLTAEELMTLLMLISVQTKKGLTLDPADAQQIVQEFDLAGDGFLGESEFIRMVQDLECELNVPQNGGPEIQPHLVLHFDVNNTCLIGDTVANMTEEQSMQTMLSRCCWGIASKRVDGSAVWVLVCPEPQPTSPWAGLTSYSQFIAEAYPFPEGADRDTLARVKKLRKQKYETFCNCGEPGEVMKPQLDVLLEHLKALQPSGRAAAGGAAPQKMCLLPSFYFALQELKRRNRSFTVVFRTFGVDLDEHVAGEFNAFCEGRHPLFASGPRLDGSDGGPDHRIDLKDASSMGTFFRGGDGRISLIWGTHQQPKPPEGIEFYDAVPSAKVQLGAEAAAESLERRFLERSHTVVLRDYYPGWEKVAFSGMGGKPVFLHIEDDTIMQIFFDDNLRPVDPNIVDAVDPRSYPHRIPMAQAFRVHLVPALPVWAVRDQTYFLDNIERCERLKKEQLSRRRQVARVLHDSQAVRRAIDLLRGPDDSRRMSGTRRRSDSKKFTAWKDLPFVRDATPFEPPGQPPVLEIDQGESMHWPQKPNTSTLPTPGSSSSEGIEPVVPPLPGLGNVPVAPLKFAGELEQRSFLHNEWAPFLDELNELLAATRRRRQSNFSLYEVMPSQPIICRLSQTCMQLTERWHGRPNASAMYKFLMEAAEHDGHSPYSFDDLPQQRSPDGFVRVLDGQVRSRLYTESAARSKSTVPSPVGIGSVKQTAGESPIDNLVLPCLSRRSKAIRLRAGHRIQQFFVRELQKRQRRLLDQFGVTPDQAAKDPEHVQSLLGDELMSMDEIAEEVDGRAGMTLARALLVEQGKVLESYGQLSASTRGTLEDYLSQELCSADRLEDELDAEMEEFLKHCEQHPGRSFNNSAVEHKLMLLRAFATPGIRVLWRSELEHFTQHRYFALGWRRVVPLLALTQKAKCDAGATPVMCELRPSGAQEFSRFRKNVFAYGEGHGLGQAGGGCAETPPWAPGTLMYEFGSLLCADEAAKVANHRVTDIEKIVMDSMLLCPHGGEGSALPGEALHDTGQNPVIASSIGQTLHVQVTRATASDFPLMAERSSPRWCTAVQAWFDIVQVGQSQDAFFVQARSRHPDSAPLLRMVTGLRAHLMEVFGHNVDFSATCHPTRDGEFLLCLAPVACLQKIQVPKGEGCRGLDFDFLNPDLELRVTQTGLPVATVDCSQGKGNFLANNDECWHKALEGRPILERLYDFNRKPGSRSVVDAYFKDLEDAASIWLRAVVSLCPFGVLGTQISLDGSVARRAAEPGAGIGVLDAVTAPSGSPARASLHRYGGRDCVHLTVPSLAGRSLSRADLTTELSRCYAAALKTLAEESVLRGLRLLPLGSDASAGTDLAEVLPDITRDALKQGFAMLSAEEQIKVVTAESVELCIFAEAEFPSFETAFKYTL